MSATNSCEFDLNYAVVWENLQESSSKNKVLKQFASSKSDEARIRVVSKYLHDTKELIFFPNCQKRNTKGDVELACKARIDGNTALQKDGNLPKALYFYNSSVAIAPYPVSETDDVLAKAFGNRSFVYMKMGKYASCIRDIDQALKYNYPDDLKPKLLERKEKCLQKIRETKKESNGNTKEVVDDKKGNGVTPPSSPVQDKAMMSELEQLQIKLPSYVSAELAVKPPVSPMLLKTYGQHKTILCASDCLEIDFSQTGGRYLKATRDIKPGDVIVFEEPYASVLQPEDYRSHCYNCLIMCDGLIPCTHCALAMYCSEDCRDKSWSSSHDLECPLLESLYHEKIGLKALLALRILFLSVKKYKGLRGLYNEVQALERSNCDEAMKGFDGNGQFNSSAYAAIHHMVYNVEKRSLENLFLNAIKAAFLLHCIETYSKETFAIDSPTKDDPEWRLFVGGLLLRFTLVVGCNASTVSEVVVQPKVVSLIDECDYNYGAALYTLPINHSCDPNVDKIHSQGHHRAFIAVQPIKMGKEISSNYGFFYGSEPLKERQVILQTHFQFTCDCTACLNKWPTINKLPSKPVFICKSCQAELPKAASGVVTCKMCAESNDICSIKSTVDNAMKSYESMKREYESKWMTKHHSEVVEIVPKMADVLATLHSCIQPPSHNLILCLDLFREALLAAGNSYVLL